MSAQHFFDGVTVRLAAPDGFVDASVACPLFLEEYQREQEILAVYLDADPANPFTCNGTALPDPFVEVLVPEKTSVMRQVEAPFFEACKFGVEESIRGFSVQADDAEQGPLPPMGTFTDGPGWFSCCTLRYRADCLLGPRMSEESEIPSSMGEAVSGGAFARQAMAPCLTGNVVFLVGHLPVIVNLHRSLDPKRARDCFDWMVESTESWRRVLLPLNGINL